MSLHAAPHGNPTDPDQWDGRGSGGRGVRCGRGSRGRGRSRGAPRGGGALQPEPQTADLAASAGRGRDDEGGIVRGRDRGFNRGYGRGLSRGRGRRTSRGVYRVQPEPQAADPVTSVGVGVGGCDGGRVVGAFGRGRGRGTSRGGDAPQPEPQAADLATTSDRGRGDVGGVRRGFGRVRGRGTPRGLGTHQPKGPTVKLPRLRQTIGVRRPDYGSAGRVIPLLANVFPVTINSDKMIFYYGVVIESGTAPFRFNTVIQSDTSPFTFNLKHLVVQPDMSPFKFNMKLFQHLQLLHEDVFTPRAVYDGKDHMYAPRQLQLGPINSLEFDVSSPEGVEGGRPPRMYNVKLRKGGEINTAVLRRFADQKQSINEDVSMEIEAFNAAIRMEPKQNYPSNECSFFTPEGKKLVGRGLELWRGYFQSLRLSTNRLILNVNTSTGVMYRSGSLIDLCLDFLGKPGQHGILSPANGLVSDRERSRLQKFITGLKVQIRTTTLGPQQFGVICSISKTSAEQTFFDHDGVRMNVAQYFRDISNQPIQYPSMVCVEVGSGVKCPLELCTVPGGQIARGLLPPDIARELTAFSTERPIERFRDIENGVRLLAYGQSEYVRQFGLTVDTSGPIRLDGRVLQPPTLQYGEGSHEKNIIPCSGTWNMADKLFFKPTTIRQWVVVVYETKRRFGDTQARTLVQNFISACIRVGITIVERNPIIKWWPREGPVEDQIRAAGYECERTKGELPNLVVAILPEKRDYIYKAVKYFGDVVVGVATQCIKSKNVFRADVRFWTHVMLKVNVKLGGINVIPDHASVPLLTDPNTPTIVMGANMMSSAPGLRGAPFYAALVGSVDTNVSKYVAVTELQQDYSRSIQNLEDMCKAVLQKYVGYRRDVENTTVPLKRLILYRGGVSEGELEYKHDRIVELRAIRAACAHFGFQPKITLIVVGKEHHIRFMPQNKNDADGSGNAPAGTVVDLGLGHSSEFDFYLQGHEGLLGTSRSSHCTVLYDDNDFDSDSLQSLSFALCHVYARSTCSVSLPAPAYYANIVCSRAKLHYDPRELRTAVLSETTIVDRLKSRFRPLHVNQAERMYFM